MDVDPTVVSFSDTPLIDIRVPHTGHTVRDARAWCAAIRRTGPLSLIFDLRGAFYAGIGGLSDHILHLTDPPSLLSADISKFAPSFQPRQGEPVALWVRLKAELTHRANGRGVRAARAVVVTTQRIAAEVKESYGVEPIVVRPGADAVADAVKLSPPKPQFRMVSVSRLESEKNIDLILQALDTIVSLPQEVPDPHLDVIGTGERLDELARLARDLGLADRVTFHGRLNDERVAKLTDGAGVVVVAARQGYGLPALEALGSGVPVVVADASGVVEVLPRDSPWVEVVPTTSAGLAAGILKIARSHTARQQTAIPVIPTTAGWVEGLVDVLFGSART